MEQLFNNLPFSVEEKRIAVLIRERSSEHTINEYISLCLARTVTKRKNAGQFPRRKDEEWADWAIRGYLGLKD